MKIGIIGGTFNPVHIGHVMLAKNFNELLGFDRILVIPSGTPPHKEYLASVTDKNRIDMCRLAFDEDIFTVSDMEIKRGGKSYTIDTLRQIKSEFPDSELFLMMGADMLMIFDKWKDYREIFKFATLCAAFRNVCARDEILSYAEKLREDGAKLIIDDRKIPDVSSTQIRSLLAKNESAAKLVPESVADYIEKNLLYRGAEG